MRFLFVHQNFPGQFLHLARYLARSGEHEILFISEPPVNAMRGVRVIPYNRPTLDVPTTHVAARELDNGVRRADAVFKAAWGLRYLGFQPDIVIGHHGWGEMLSLPDVWPDVPMLGYLEFYYRHDSGDVGFDPEFPADVYDFGRIRAKNAINHIALNLPGEGQSPTQWQMSTYPDWARPRINMVWEGVDTDVCSPDPTVRRRSLAVGGMAIRPTDKLVTYVSRDLEPYRGFHSMMRALPHLMRARPDVKVVMIGGDGASYGSLPPSGLTWKQTLLKEVGAELDMDRVVFPGRVPYDLYLSLLRRSDAHVYLTYPFVASWSLREALSVGVPLIGSDTEPVREFITDGENGLLVPFLEPRAIAERVLGVLEDRHLTGRLRAAARAYAEKNLQMQDYLDSYTGLIARLTGQHPVSPPEPARRSRGTAAPARKAAAKVVSASGSKPASGARQKAAGKPAPKAESKTTSKAAARPKASTTAAGRARGAGRTAAG